MSLLPEDSAVSALIDCALDAMGDDIPGPDLPEGWRQASYEDLADAGWSDSEIDDIGLCVVDADGRLLQVEVDVTLSPLRRATPEEIAAVEAAIAASRGAPT